MSAVIGIDIGTSSSAIAYKYGEEFPVIITPQEKSEYEYEEKGFPSSLMFGANGKFLRLADNLSKEHSGFLLRYFKRIVGYNFEEIDRQIRNGERFLNEYKDIIERGDKGSLLIRFGEERYTVEKIMAIFLKELNNCVKEMIEETIDKAIIAIPSYFTLAQRESMRRVSEIVFGKLVELIQEPLAAIIGCNLHTEARKRPVMVFDLGTGSLEIKVAKITLTKDRRFKLITLKTVRQNIGGIDMDYAILEYLMEKNRNLRDLFPSAPPKERKNFLWAIEKAKMALSLRLETKMMATIGEQPIEEGLSRAKLEELIKPIIKDCENALSQIVEEKKLLKEIGHLILVGGPTRMPSVRRMLKGVFADNPRLVEMLKEKEKAFTDPWPMEIVAKGASTYPAACPAVDYGTVFIEREEATKGAPFTYGPFYDDVGFVPIIYKGDTFGEDGAIRREGTAFFSQPNGQISIVQREERKGRTHSYLCLGIFSFFLPPQESYKMKFNLELELGGHLTLIGQHHAVGDILYPHISLELDGDRKELSNEISLREHIHDLMAEKSISQRGLYWTIDLDALTKHARFVQEKITPYYGILEMKEITDKLGEAIYWFKRTIISSSRFASQSRSMAAILLNRMAEACFALLRYDLFSFNDYIKMTKSLHSIYRVGIEG